MSPENVYTRHVEGTKQYKFKYGDYDRYYYAEDKFYISSSYPFTVVAIPILCMTLGVLLIIAYTYRQLSAFKVCGTLLLFASIFIFSIALFELHRIRRLLNANFIREINRSKRSNDFIQGICFKCLTAVVDDKCPCCGERYKLPVNDKDSQWI